MSISGVFERYSITYYEMSLEAADLILQEPFVEVACKNRNPPQQPNAQYKHTKPKQ